MEIRTLITFLRVAELRSFSRAAAQLGYSQAAMTIPIRQPEERLGVQLFERIGKKVRLTEEGRNLIPRAIDVMNAVRAVRDLGRGDEPAGQLRLGTAESLLISVLPPVMMEFCRRCPKVEFSTCTDMVTGLFDMVRQNDIDVLYFLDRRTNFPEWVKVAERRERALFVTSPANPLARERHISVERLLMEPLLLTEKGVSYRYAMEQELAAAGQEIRPVLETGNTDILTQMLLKNMGVSFLPEFVVRDYLADGRLAALDTVCPEIEMWSQLVYHRNKLVTPQMEIFLDLMKKNMESRE